MSILNNPPLTVSDVMLSLDKCPLVEDTSLLKQALDAMDKYRLGVVCIVDNSQELKGILTDGDIRRILLTVQKPLAALLADDVERYKISQPIVIGRQALLKSAIELMGEKKVWDLPVVSKEGKLVGLVHLHQALLTVLKNVTP
jgi:CBS domain-containing protein